MRRMAFAVVVLLGCCTGPARAETLPMLIGVPETYTPGTPFSFQVRVPELFDFSSYRVELLFDTRVQDPPLFASSVKAAGALYPFPTNTGYTSTLSTFAGSQQIILTIADAYAPPDPNSPRTVNVTPGENDTLATVTVRPLAGFAGPIKISIGEGGTEFIYFSEDGSAPPPEPVTVNEVEEAPPADPVPAPAGAALVAIGGIVVGLRQRLARRAG